MIFLKEVSVLKFNIEINQTIDDYSSDEFGEFGEGGDEDRVAVDFSEEGFVKNITIETDEVAGMGDVDVDLSTGRNSR